MFPPKLLEILVVVTYFLIYCVPPKKLHITKDKVSFCLFILKNSMLESLHVFREDFFHI